MSRAHLRAQWGKALRRDAELHERGELAVLGSDFDELDKASRDEAVDGSDAEAFRIARSFWEAWLDSRNHNFQQEFYEGIRPEDWPTIARDLARSLEQGERVTNAAALRTFGQNAEISRRPRRLWWAALVAALLLYLGFRAM